MKKRIVELIIAFLIAMIPLSIILLCIYFDAKSEKVITAYYEPFKPVTVWSMPEDTNLKSVETVEWDNKLDSVIIHKDGIIVHTRKN